MPSKLQSGQNGFAPPQRVGELLQATRRAELEQFAYQATQVVRGGDNRVSLGNVLDAA